MHNGNWWSYIRYDEKQDRPEVSRALLARVWGYGKPYASKIALMLLTMIAIPILSGLVGVGQRYLGSHIGEGIIFDLRNSLYQHLQRMSLRFFTNTKTGEVMARLNNDVVGAQQAVTSTSVNIISNAISLVMTAAVMVSLEWRLTLLSVLVLPF